MMILNLRHLQVLKLVIMATGYPQSIRCGVKSDSKNGMDKFECGQVFLVILFI